MPYLKQSTAVDIGMGPFLDSTDGNTAETGLTITQPDIRLKKNGGAWAQKSAAQTLSHEENGWYEVSLSDTDTNTLGILIVAIHESGALAAWETYQVVSAAFYDFMCGTSALPVNVTQISGDSGAADNAEAFFDGTGYAGTNNVIPTVTTVNGLAANVITAASIAADAIGSSELAASAVTEIQSGLALAADLATVAGYLDTEIAAIKARTDNLPAAPAATGDIPSAATIANAVWDEPLAEPAGVFNWSATRNTMRDLFQWIGAAIRNKHPTSETTDTVRNDADTADIASAPLSNTGGVFTRGKYT